MLNKLTFNNLVISNKKGIQQSQIQTINKLVHKIRKLKSLFEKHPENSKCKERIRKSTETMEILKKLKRVDIMKKVLLMDKPASAILTNGLATPEELSVALLSMNKVMQGLTKRFKLELQIDESKSDDWKQVLMESSKRKKKIERTEEKRRRRLETKQQKAMGRKRHEWLEENQINIKEASPSSDSEKNISTTGNWQIEDISNDKIGVMTEENTIDSNRKIKKTKPEKTVIKTSLPNKIQRTENEPNNIAGSDVINDTFASSNETNISDHQEMDIEERLEVDPFFITDNGENYMSSANSKKDDSVEENNNEQRKDLHMIKLNKFDRKSFVFNDRQNSNRRQNGNNWNGNKIAQNRGNNRYEQNELTSGKWTGRNGPQLRQNENHRNHANTNTEKSLHPSWAAKQKIKPVITNFQGKKIKFEDNEHKGKGNSLLQNSKPKTIKTNKPVEESLHPSWAAKQKLKPTITAFQGKKITFDNDE